MKSVLFFLLLAATFAVVHYVTAVPVSSTKLQSQEAQLASWKSSFKTVLDKIERDKVPVDLDLDLVLLLNPFPAKGSLRKRLLSFRVYKNQSRQLKMQ